MFSKFCYAKILVFAVIVALPSMLGTSYIEDMYQTSIKHVCFSFGMSNMQIRRNSSNVSYKF